MHYCTISASESTLQTQPRPPYSKVFSTNASPSPVKSSPHARHQPPGRASSPRPAVQIAPVHPKPRELVPTSHSPEHAARHLFQEQVLQARQAAHQLADLLHRWLPLVAICHVQVEDVDITL